MHIYIYIYIYMCVCVWLYVYHKVDKIAWLLAICMCESTSLCAVCAHVHFYSDVHAMYVFIRMYAWSLATIWNSIHVFMFVCIAALVHDMYISYILCIQVSYRLRSTLSSSTWHCTLFLAASLAQHFEVKPSFPMLITSQSGVLSSRLPKLRLIHSWSKLQLSG